MELFIISLIIIIVRIVTSAFIGDMPSRIRLVFRLTSYFGMLLVCAFIAGRAGGFPYYMNGLFVIIVTFALTFILRRSITVGNALEIAMSGLLVCLTAYVFIDLFRLSKSPGLCFVSCAGFYDIWYLSVISLEHEERHRFNKAELLAASVIILLSSAVYGFLIFRATFFALNGMRDLLSVLICTAMTVYAPVCITAAFIAGERNNRPFQNPFTAFRKRRTFTYKSFGEKDLHWDYEGGEQEYDWGRDPRGSKTGKKRGSGEYQKAGTGRSGEQTSSGEGFESSILGDDVKKAMRIFGIRSLNELSRESLDRKRRELMKRYHPDSGSAGSTERAGEINAAYDLLKRYI